MPYDKYFLSESKPEINPQSLESIVRHALIEDIGRGDITTQLTIPKDKMIKAKIIAKEDFFLCGLLVAEKVFKIVDNSVDFEAKIKEGKPVMTRIYKKYNKRNFAISYGHQLDALVIQHTIYCF